MKGFVLHNPDCTEFPQHLETSTGVPPAPPEGYLWCAVPLPATAYQAEPDGEGGYSPVLIVVSPADQLSAAQAKRWNDAKAYRDARMSSACPTPAGMVQIDDASKLKINGLVSMAMISKTLGAPFSVNFTLFDNSVIAMSSDEMISLGVAVGEFVAACQDAGTAVRAAIDAATDLGAVDAVDVTAGYPA